MLPTIFQKSDFGNLLETPKNDFSPRQNLELIYFFVDFVEIGILKSLTLPNFTILVRKPYSRKIENREIAKNIVSAKNSCKIWKVLQKKRVLKSLTLRIFFILGR